MIEYVKLCPLLFSRRWPRRNLPDITANIDIDIVRSEYARLVEVAPKRPEGMPYLRKRTGIPFSTKPSNRREEHIAIALFNMRQCWPLPDGSTFELLDYQVPLKSRRIDAGIGKVDLLGLSSDGRLVFVELKVARDCGGTGDPPPAALMEAIRYAAILESNRDRIRAEVGRAFCHTLSDRPPVLLILGEQDWWANWATCRPALKGKAEEASKALGLSIVLGILANCHLIYGKGGAAPLLRAEPRLVYE